MKDGLTRVDIRGERPYTIRVIWDDEADEIVRIVKMFNDGTYQVLIRKY